MAIDDAAKTYMLAPTAMAVDLEDESVVFSMAAGKYFGVRGALRHVMLALETGCTRATMVARLCDVYDVSEAAAGADLDRILPELIAAGILEIHAPTAP